MCSIETVKRHLAASNNVDIAQHDVGELRHQFAVPALVLIVAVHQDGILNVPDTDIVVEDVMHLAALVGVRLDPNAVVRSIDRKIGDKYEARAAVSLAAD